MNFNILGHELVTAVARNDFFKDTFFFKLHLCTSICPCLPAIISEETYEESFLSLNHVGHTKQTKRLSNKWIPLLSHVSQQSLPLQFFWDGYNFFKITFNFVPLQDL